MTLRTRPLTEAQWQRQVTDLAEHLGWSWVHHRPARTEQGWRTPVSGPMGAGWPDLVLVRERIVFAELKTARGRLSEDQEEVVAYLLPCAGAEVYVWRPGDWDEVQAALKRIERRAPYNQTLRR